MTGQLIDPQDSNEEQCSICLCDLCDEQSYQMPECNHKFHTNCIMHWFRDGNRKCPYCNNRGSGINRNSLDQGYSFNGWRACQCTERYKMLRRQSGKKDCPNIIKKIVDKLKNLENKLKEMRAQHKKDKDLKLTYKEWQNLSRKNRRQLWTLINNIRRTKNELCECNVVPLIIVQKKTI